MYIIELFFKLKNFKRKQKEKIVEDIDLFENECEHVFLPVDSTKEVLACTKCGLVIKNEPTKNFFKK